MGTHDHAAPIPTFDHVQAPDATFLLPGSPQRAGLLDPPDVDAIEQHRQYRRIDDDLLRVGPHLGEPEAATLEPLVVKDEAALIPDQGSSLDPRAGSQTRTGWPL